MTKLQVTINNLKDVCIAAELVLEKLEKAQKDLETPPPHKWEHRDIFENQFRNIMICIEDITFAPKELLVFCLTAGGCDCHHHSGDFLPKGKFLFNIKEKL